MLVHSFLYYQLNTNIISDTTFDAWARELANLMRDYPEDAKLTYHYKSFKDFTGDTGYDLPFADPLVQSRAQQLLNIQRKMVKK